MEKRLMDLEVKDLDHLTICEDCYKNRLNCPFYFAAGCHKNNYKRLLENPALIIFELNRKEKVEVADYE